MLKPATILFLILLLLQQCQVPSVNLTDKVDPDIVFVNMENGDRAFLGKLLLKIDSLHPILIGIDAIFAEQRDPKQDSILMASFRKINNDILVYDINQNGIYSHSNKNFIS